jgi:hypothetical protein
MSRTRELAEFATAYDSGNPLGFRNRIINGDMRIDQRNAGAAQSDSAGASPFSVDRWRVVTRTGATITYGQYPASLPSTARQFLGLTITSAKTPAANDQFRVNQGIEGLNVLDFWWGTAGAQTVTLSFWSCHSQTGTFSGAFFNGSANRSYVFTYTQNAANTWEYKTVTIAGDTTGTWAIDNTAGINVSFDYGCGSDFQTGTTGSWLSGIFLKATGSVSPVTSANAIFRITGVQLEAGSVATPFERRPYGTELQLCRRYARQIRHVDFRYGNSTGDKWATITLEPPMRSDTLAITLTNPYNSTFVSASNAGRITIATNAAPANGAIGFDGAFVASEL